MSDNRLTFNFHWPAVGKESVRGNGNFYIPDKTRNYIKQCASIFRKSGLDEPLKGPLFVEITCYFKRPRSVHPGEHWMARKPDADNIEKAIYDAGSGILWEDDAQISLSVTRKYWGDEDMVTVVVDKL